MLLFSSLNFLQNFVVGGKHLQDTKKKLFGLQYLFFKEKYIEVIRITKIEFTVILFIKI